MNSVACKQDANAETSRDSSAPTQRTGPYIMHLGSRSKVDLNH